MAWNGKSSSGDGEICGQDWNTQFAFANGNGPTGTSLPAGIYVTKSSATTSGKKIYSTENLVSAMIQAGTLEDKTGPSFITVKHPTWVKGCVHANIAGMKAIYLKLFVPSVANYPCLPEWVNFKD